MSNNNIFKEVNEKASIEAVISYYLGANSLVKQGKVFMCKCPFHNDSHPSMRIDPSRNMFKCFVDGKGGSPIQFAIDYAHLTPIEALKKVCEICHLDLPEGLSNSNENSINSKYKDELQALDSLRQFYELTLKSKDGEKGLNYLENRKIDEEICKHFSLGYAPIDQSASINSLKKLGFDIKCLENAGILSNQRNKDFFSERVIFPIKDNYGRTVAFSGRIINKEQSDKKYINYPDTQLFKKGQVLYHYFSAKETAKKDNFIYLVEGFMDVIAIYRAGINSVCGTMGTALTIENVLNLKRLDVEVRLCLDSDEPGQLGIARCIDLLEKNNVKYRVVRKFKGGKDADEILTNFGKENLIEQLNNLYDGFLFTLGRCLNGQKKMTEPTQIESFFDKVRLIYSNLDDISKDKDLTILSSITDIEPAILSKGLLNNEKISTKTDDKKTFSPIKKRGNKKPYIEITKTNNFNLDKNVYFQVDNVSQMDNLALNTEDGKNINKQIISLETQILIVLTQSKKAYEEFEKQKVPFKLKGYYHISSFIGDFYLSYPDRKSLDNYAYDYILNKFINDQSQDEEMDDEFGLDEDKSEELPEEMISFMVSTINFLKGFTTNYYDENNFKLSLLKHCGLCKIDDLDKEYRFTYGNSANEDAKIKLSQEKQKLKKEYKLI